MSAVFHFERVNQTDARVTWAGSWTLESNAANAYGKGYKYSMSVGAYALCTFYGTRVKFISPKVANEGYADIYVDDVLKTTVDMYADPRQDQAVVFESEMLTLGTHTIKVVVNGGKNASSSGTWICVDAFDVFNDSIQVPYERIHSSQSGYSPSGFYVSASVENWGGWSNMSTTVAAFFDFAFYGSRVAWVGRKNTGYDIAEVFLDGVSQGMVDCYAAAPESMAVVWDSGAIDNGVHWVRVVNTGTKNPSATGTYTSVNAFDVYRSVAPAAEQPRDEKATGYYASTWATGSNAEHYGGTMLFTNTAGAVLDFDFYGDRVKVYGYKAASYGHMGVYLDGALVATADLYSALSLFQQLLWDSGAITPGIHRLRLTRAGTKNASSSSYQVDLDYIQVFNTPIPFDPGAIARMYPGIPGQRVYPQVPPQRAFPL